MDENRAKNLVRETLQADFDRNKFIYFIKNLLYKKSTQEIRDTSITLWKEFEDYINKYFTLGTYTDPEGKLIEILRVELKSNKSPENARVKQRNFVAKFLKNKNKDAAIVAFYEPNVPEWRFSFIKVEYDLGGGDLLTPPRRSSFLVGREEPNHTAQKQLVELLINEERNPTLSEIERAFGIEKVTKEFFERYEELYLKLKESLEKVIKRNANVKKEFMRIVQNDEEQLQNFTVEFSKKLLGQIVFLYFLQKKGWLGVGIYDKWGTGPKDFMRQLYGGGKNNYTPLVKYNNFFNEILEPLFYDTLARKRDGDYCKFGNVAFKIPFLNGGLFEPLDGYKWEATDINLDNNIFKDILDTFDEFNFTVKEDEPLEKEVAVDPEMLGKVFEKLLEVNDRKSKGAFYTPREIVHYMCQQSLINYLETNSSISREDIEKFIEMGDITTSNDERILIQIKEKQEKLQKGIISAATFGKEVEELSNQLNLPRSIVQNKEDIDKLLKDIKVVDPAVGSGAFPVGMMNEIVKARSILSLFFSEERNVYDIKRECIENSLYGVDIMPSAVDICQLRFWLSLIVDEEDKDKVKPLPNLDNKIMCGDSLLEEFEGVKLFDESLLGEEVKDIRPELTRIDNEIKEINLKIGQIITGKLKGDYKEFKKEVQKKEREKKKLLEKPTEERNTTLDEIGQQKIKESKLKLAKLKRLHQELFNEYDRDKKKSLKEEIDKLEWELIKVTLEEQCSEEALDKLDKIMRSKSKPFFVWKLKFFEVFQGENPGFDVVIANPPYGVSIKGDYREVVLKEFGKVPDYEIYYYFIELSRNLLRNGGTKSYIIPNTFLFNVFASEYRKKLLDNWDINTIIDCTAFKLFDSATVYNAITIFKKTLRGGDKIGYKQTADADSFLSLARRPTSLISKEILISNNINWGLAFKLPNEYLNLIAKIKKNKLTLKDIFPEISQGLIAYDKYRGQNQDIIKNRSFHFTKKIKKCLKKWLWGEDITPYKVRWNKKEYIDYCDGIANPRDPKFFRGKRLLVREITNPKIYAGYTENEQYHDPAIITILDNQQNILPLLGILNSKLATFYHFNSSPKATKGAFPKILIKDIKEFPLPNWECAKKIITQVNQILSITKDDDYLDNPEKRAKVKCLEDEIDPLVYKLYDLTEDEIEIVKNFNIK